MSDTLIKVEGLYKKFCRSLKRSMAYGTIDAAKSMFGIEYDQTQLRKNEFWALQDINFEIKQGEKIGFLGENGSGKTTLLRLLNGIFPIDAGKITIKGKIGALIAVGAGFHPQMTGRENIFLNGTILGMTKAELKRKFDEIVDFADIGDFLDAPVATYSSGMYVRLGFSIAVHSNVDIMLVDEILAVGDLAFQLKCQRKLSEFRQNGGTFIIVAHNMQVIRNTCAKVFWLNNGKIIDAGDVYNICNKYETSQLLKGRESSNKDDRNINIINNDLNVHIKSVNFLNINNEETNIFKTNDYLKIRITYNCDRIVFKPIFVVGITNINGVIIAEIYSNSDNLNIKSISDEDIVELEIICLNIKPDNYLCSVMLCEYENLNVLEWHEKMYNITILNGKLPINQGLIHLDSKWKTNIKKEIII